MIWIDVNQLVNWRGPLSGIQRTQFEFARAASLNDDVSFFFQGANGLSTEYLFDSHLLAAQFESVLKSQQQTVPSRFSRIVRKIQRILFSSISGQNNESSQTTSSAGSIFKQGDTVLFVGASWIQEVAVAEAVRIPGVKVGVLLYDMIPILHPEFFGHGYGEHFTTFTFDGLSGVDFYLSISDTTTQDFLQLCRDRAIVPKPIFRLELGSAVNEKIGQPPIQISQEDPYVLSVGTIEIRKNYGLLYETWSLAEQRGIRLPTLVIAGKQGWLAEDTYKKLAHARHNFAKILVLESVTDPQLNWLYQNALFTLYPSLYEGWGLPITESLAAGKLCVAAETRASREAGQGLTVHVDPHDPNDLLKEIQLLLMSPENLKTLEEKIRNSFVPTLWEISVAKVLTEIKASIN